MVELSINEDRTVDFAFEKGGTQVHGTLEWDFVAYSENWSNYQIAYTKSYALQVVGEVELEYILSDQEILQFMNQVDDRICREPYNYNER